MRKIMTAFSFAALALIGINAGSAQTNTQLADVRYEYPTNADESDVNLRDIADIRYEYPTNDDEDDVPLREIADVRYDFPADEIDGDSPELLVPGSLA